jgi:flavorubredoxin
VKIYLQFLKKNGIEMITSEIKPGVYFVGSIDWDRRLFDELIPLPEGTSYNAYLIKGKEKTALIDTVDPTKENELIANLKELHVSKIDYLISNHAEQDHSGGIPKILALYPEAQVVTNPKCKEFLKELLLVPEEKFLTINNGDVLTLGDKSLEFILAPWVHWPETMFTYLREDSILFTCDLFGSHMATSDLFTGDKCRSYESAKRYYAEIMMPFRNGIKKYIEKIKKMNIEVIAPSHGTVHDTPDFILDAYEEWISDDVKNEVVIAYVSMHNSVRKMVEYIVDIFIKKGLPIKVFNLTKTDLGEFAMALVDAATVVIATPTVLAGAHPTAVYATYLINALRPKCKFLSMILSYGWGGRAEEQIKGLLTSVGAEFIEPVIIRGYPKEKDFKALERLADDILSKHNDLNILP